MDRLFVYVGSKSEQLTSASTSSMSAASRQRINWLLVFNVA